MLIAVTVGNVHLGRRSVLFKQLIPHHGRKERVDNVSGPLCLVQNNVVAFLHIKPQNGKANETAHQSDGLNSDQQNLFSRQRDARDAVGGGRGRSFNRSLDVIAVPINRSSLLGDTEHGNKVSCWVHRNVIGTHSR